MSPTPAILPPPGGLVLSGRPAARRRSAIRSLVTARHPGRAGPDRGGQAPDRSRPAAAGHDGVWTGRRPRASSAGQRYGYRVHGDWAPHAGARFNPAKLLLDPYARAITGGVDYSRPDPATTPRPRTTSRTAGTPSTPCRSSVVVADTPPPTPLARPVPMADTVLYELHVKGFTRLHPAVPEHLRGTYAGLAYPAVIEHLMELGVTSVQLLPVHHFVSEPFLIRRGLSNYWGYNTLGFFAPHCRVRLGRHPGPAGRGSSRRWSRRCTRAGLEVILDVVYNHTGEGGHEGPDALLPRDRPLRLLPADRRPAHRLRRHRLRQLGGHLRSRACCSWCSTRCATGSPRWASTASASTWSPR